MKRRQFLTIGGAGGGACFFAGDLWRLNELVGDVEVIYG